MRQISVTNWVMTKVLQLIKPIIILNELFPYNQEAYDTFL